MIKLGSDKKPHRQTSGKAPIEGGDAEEDLMYLRAMIGMIITYRYHMRESALSSPLALELKGIAKGKFPYGCHNVKCCPKELGPLTFAELVLRAGCHPNDGDDDDGDDDDDGFFITNKIRRVIKQ